MSLHRRKKITISLLIPFIIFVLFFSIMIWQKYRSSQEVLVIPPQAGMQNMRSVTLFFTADGVHLTRETRALDQCDDDTACLKNVLDELLNGPISELSETVPEGVIVSSVSIEGDQGTIKFNNMFSEAMPSGSSAEMLAVYSVVNTTAINFPQIRKVKIEVDGNKTGTLHHLDISDPLMPDYTLELPTPTASGK
ncbi:MAG: GerMN domain-containing protein [Desulfuromonadaceae bacterium]